MYLNITTSLLGQCDKLENFKQRCDEYNQHKHLQFNIDQTSRWTQNSRGICTSLLAIFKTGPRPYLQLHQHLQFETHTLSRSLQLIAMVQTQLVDLSLAHSSQFSGVDIHHAPRVKSCITTISSSNSKIHKLTSIREARSPAAARQIREHVNNMAKHICKY